MDSWVIIRSKGKYVFEPVHKWMSMLQWQANALAPRIRGFNLNWTVVIKVSLIIGLRLIALGRMQRWDSKDYGL